MLMLMLLMMLMFARCLLLAQRNAPQRNNSRTVSSIAQSHERLTVFVQRWRKQRRVAGVDERTQSEQRAAELVAQLASIDERISGSW